MAKSATSIILFHSTTPGATPGVGSLAAGEIALNNADGKLYYYDTNDLAIKELNSDTADNLAGGATGSIPYQSAAGVTTFLAAGTNGQAVVQAGGVPTWASIVNSVAGDTGANIGLTLTPSAATGAITLDLGGVLDIAHGGTGAATVGNNLFFAGPTTGGPLAPSYRGIASGDLTTALSAPPAIGGGTAAAGTFTTLTATTAVDTNLQVTNIKALDGTSAGSIADTTGVVTLASAVLTTADINAGTIDATTIGGGTPAAGSFTSLTASSANVNVTLSPTGTGTVTIDPATAGAMDNVVIGASTPAAATVTSITATTGTVSTTPSANTDIANKLYVDDMVQGIQNKYSVVRATTAADGNLALNGLVSVDGAVVTAGDEILVKNQTLSEENGIYVASAGAWTRATEMDTWPEVVGAFTFVQQGTVNGSTGWVAIVPDTGTIGVTPMPWTQFSGAGTYTAGNGLTLTGTQFSINTAITADLTTAQTMTNKTLTSPAINTATIAGGTINNAIIGGATPAAGTFTLLTATTGLDNTPYVETAAIKAQDGTASATIADTTGVMTITSAVLTTADINGGTADNVVIGGAVPAAATVTDLTATSSNAVVDLSPAGTGGVTISPAGSASVVIDPTSAGSIDNMVIGGTTPLAITGTTITATTYNGISGGTFP